MKPTRRLTLISMAIATVSIIAAGTGAAVTGAQTATPVPEAAPYALPASLDDGHFLLEVAPAYSLQSPLISPDSAVSLARSSAGGLAVAPTGVSVQLVLFTDRNRGVENPDGSFTLSFLRVPAYVVRFTGVPQPVLGVSGPRDRPAVQELNVVIDARTGDYLEMSASSNNGTRRPCGQWRPLWPCRQPGW